MRSTDELYVYKYELPEEEEEEEQEQEEQEEEQEDGEVYNKQSMSHQGLNIASMLSDALFKAAGIG